MGEPRCIAIYETVGQDYRICLGKIDLGRVIGFQSFAKEIESKVRVVSTKVTKQYKIHVASALNPLFQYDIIYMDFDDNCLDIMMTPWVIFRSRIDEIGIFQRYDMPNGREILIEGTDPIMKLDIGPIENFFYFYRALQFLGSAHTNIDPEDDFSSKEPWKGYNLYMLSNQNIILTPHLVWRLAGKSWEEEVVDIDIATVSSSVGSNNEGDELIAVNAEIDNTSTVAGVDNASSTDDDVSEMAGNIAGVDNASSTDDDASEMARNVLVSGIGFSSSEEGEVDDFFLHWETKYVTGWKEVQDILAKIVVKPKLLSG